MHREFEPPAALRDVIKCFWYDQRDFATLPTGFEVMPDGYAEIIFHFGKGCSIATGTGMQQLPSPFLMGLLSRPAVFYARDHLEIIGIRCFPWTVGELLGLLPDKKRVHTFQHPITGLHASLNTFVRMGNIVAAMALVQQYFLDARMGVAADSMLYKAGVAMSTTAGTLPVSGVAAAAHATVRTLERKFRQAAGHTIKDVSNLMRFEQVRNRLWQHPTASIAGLAQEFGYADQSHLSREFKRYSGITPAAFARRAKQGQQVISSDFVAFVQA